jgi:hypothetical protein
MKMKTYYVSLTADLLGVYIKFQAESSNAVGQYLKRTYYRNGEWKLPWCAIYNSNDKLPSDKVIVEHLGSLHEESEV